MKGEDQKGDGDEVQRRRLVYIKLVHMNFVFNKMNFVFNEINFIGFVWMCKFCFSDKLR